MKILIYADSFAPRVGGVETYAMLLASGLAGRTALATHERTEVTLVTRTPADAEKDAKLPFRVIRQPSKAKLFRLLRDTDIVHLAGPAFLPLALGLLLRKRVVIEHHGYQAACPNGLLFYQPSHSVCPGHFMAHRYAKCLRCNASTVGWMRSAWMLATTGPRRWLCRRATVNVPITSHVLKRLELPRSVVIYYGIQDIVGNRPGSIPTIDRGTPPCFAYVGRLVTEKGASMLLEAASYLEQRGVVFNIKFIGDGPERARLEAIAASKGLASRTYFSGFVVGAEFEREIENVDAVVMPSIWEETAGLAAIEHMMRGRLVVASDIGGLAEVVDGVGLVFPHGDVAALADRLSYVARHSEVASELGSKARQRALRLFTHERMTTDHVRLYQRLWQAND